MSEEVGRSARDSNDYCERLLIQDELANLLNVPKRWIQERVQQRLIPHTRLGKHIRFTASRIQEILDASRRDAEVCVVLTTVAARVVVVYDVNRTLHARRWHPTVSR